MRLTRAVLFAASWSWQLNHHVVYNWCCNVKISLASWLLPAQHDEGFCARTHIPYDKPDQHNHQPPLQHPTVQSISQVRSNTMSSRSSLSKIVGACSANMIAAGLCLYCRDGLGLDQMQLLSSTSRRSCCTPNRAPNAEHPQTRQVLNVKNLQSTKTKTVSHLTTLATTLSSTRSTGGFAALSLCGTVKSVRCSCLRSH